MLRLDQKRREFPALPLPTADRKRPERAAVIALPSRDEVSPLRLSAFDEILTRQFERSLDRLRAAAEEQYVADAVRRVRDKIIRQLLGNLRGEEARMRVGELVDLPAQGFAEHHAYLKVRDRQSYAFALVSVAAALTSSDEATGSPEEMYSRTSAADPVGDIERPRGGQNNHGSERGNGAVSDGRESAGH